MDGGREGGKEDEAQEAGVEERRGKIKMEGGKIKRNRT